MQATILVVDDHHAVRRSLREWLGMTFPQCNVVEAASGEEAVAVAQALGPRVVIMDIGLPGMSGIGATRRIKAGVPSAHIVILTILEGEAYRADASAAGASAYVPKRTMYTELVPTVEALLSRASPQPAPSEKRDSETSLSKDDESEERETAPVGKHFLRPLRSMADLRARDHLGCLYETEDERRKVLLPFLRQGLERSEKVIYIADPLAAEAVLGYLRQDLGSDKVECYLANGQLTTLAYDVASRSVRQGIFDPDAMLALLRAGKEQALAEDYAVLRVATEMTWVLRGLPGSEGTQVSQEDVRLARGLIEFEARLNEFLADSRCLVLCQYDRRVLDPAVLLDVLRTHPVAVMGGKLYDNFYYLPLTDLRGSEFAAAELHHWLMNLTERKRVEEAVRESEKTARALLNAATDMALLIDHTGTILAANETAAERLGKSIEGLLGACFYDLMPPDVSETRRARVRDVVLWGKPVRFEDTLLGTWLDNSIYPISDASDEVTRLAIYSRDISERVRTEAVRRRSEQSLRDQVAMLQALAEIDQEIIAATELPNILDLVCRRTAELVHAPKSAIFIEASPGESSRGASYGLRDAERAQEEFVGEWRSGAFRPLGVLVKNDWSAGAACLAEFCAREDICAYALVPLVVGERTLGVLMILDTMPRVWSVDEIQVLDLLAGQTAIALEKVRLYEAARSRAMRLSMLNEVGQAITSTLDLGGVLGALLEKVQQATSAEACSVALVDAATGDLVFRQAVGTVNQTITGLRLKHGQGIAGWVAEHQQSVLVHDAASDPRFCKEVDGGTGFATRELVCVPLLARDTVIGVIELVNKQGGAFGEDDIRLLESVAAQAAIVIENARLFETERAARQRVETLYRIGQTINSTLNADAILDRLTEEAMRATGASCGSVLVARPELGHFDLRSQRGYSQALVEKALSTPLPLDEGLNGVAYHTRQVVCVDDVQAEPSYFLLIPETRSELVVPIVRGDRVLGNLDLQSDEVGAFRSIDRDFMLALTDQAAIAIENAQLFQAEREQFRCLQQSQAQLIQAEKMSALGRLVASIVHEVNNPLQAIQNSLTLCEEEMERGPRPEKMARYLGIANSEIERLAGIVRRLRDFYRPTHQEMQPTDVQAVLDSVLSLSGKQLQRGKISIEPDWESGLPLVQANPDHLKQVFLNLVLNAMDAMSERGGTLRVRTARDWMQPRDGLPQPAVRVEIGDTGVGLPPEVASHLFEPFVTTKADGTGLGLSISYQIVEEHGGQITASSQAGVGTTFTILLPAPTWQNKACQVLLPLEQFAVSFPLAELNMPTPVALNDVHRQA